MARLNAGDSFPEMRVSTVGGDSLSLPVDLETPYALLLFYRAWW